MSKKHDVVSRLLNGEVARGISDTLDDVSYATVLRWSRELKDAQVAGTVDKLLNMDELALETTLDAARLTHIPEAGEAVTALVSGIEAAQVLQVSLCKTAAGVNDRLFSLTRQAGTAEELDILCDALCKLQNAFFNKNTTNVQVNNSYDSSDRAYSTFLSDEPPSDNREPVQ